MEVTAEEFYQQFEAEFTAWAQTKNDIRAGFIIGSRARKDHPADKYADMDLVMFTSQQNYYLSNDEWIKTFGDLRVSFTTQTAGNDLECLTLFRGGWQVDFVIHTAEELSYIVQNRIIPQNFYRGVRVLIDKDKIASSILPQAFTAPKSPVLTQEEFLKSVNMFWFLALYIAKQICRNEIWVAKTRDHMLKDLLLSMIEWHEKTFHGEDYDTWHAGRFLSDWASNDTLNELQQCFGYFNQNDSFSALKCTLSLYQRLSHEIAANRKFTYPQELEDSVTDWIRQNS